MPELVASAAFDGAGTEMLEGVQLRLALMDGRALPAGELARAANLSAAATSLHLQKLALGGLVAVRQEGRHRYFRLARSEVAHALEALGAIATRPAPVTNAPSPLAAARSCYDHLAGALGVALCARLESGGFVQAEDDRAFRVTDAGARWFRRKLDIDVATLDSGRRPIARGCLDWTERRNHLAGALGAAVLDRLLERKWLRRIPGTRALRVTENGDAALRALGVR